MSTPRPVRKMSQTAAFEDAVRDVINTQGGLESGEVLVHFDLVAVTRSLTNAGERIERRHWAPAGADPHLSYGLLNAQAKKIGKRLA